MTPNLVICGNGACAAALVVALAKRQVPLNVTVIGRGEPWRGVAYSATDEHHLLNVPAANMSLDNDDAERAAPWLRLRLVSAELLGLTRHPDRWHVFHDKGVQAADAVVLATGVERPSPLVERYGRAAARYLVEDPWQPWQAEPAARILILGAGLTAVDAALNLVQAGHKGPIVMLSRHGLLPLRHDLSRPSPTAIRLPAASLSRRLRNLRRAMRDVGHWQDVFDGLRPQWQALWNELSEDERRRFLRHLAVYFNIHRHRMAPRVAATLSSAQKRNLELRRGRVTAMQPERDGLRVTIRSDARDDAAWFDKVLNCTGPNSNTGLSGQTFIQSLVGAGLARPESLGLGIEVDGKNRVYGREGLQHSLFAMGALSRGRWWEITAMPEIRQQAVHVARNVSQILSSAADAMPSFNFPTSTSRQLFAKEDHEHRLPAAGP